jgi:hypothetical protein
MTFLGGGYVGPTLGASAVDAGVAASLGGLLLVAAFMLVYYRRAGVNAVIALMANMALLLGAMAYLGAALTLPGIAGLILTIGMGVDSNVLIFERIKEELRAGQTVRRAVTAGFDRVFLTSSTRTSRRSSRRRSSSSSAAARSAASRRSSASVADQHVHSVVVSRTMFEWTLARGGRPRLGSERPGLMAARGPIDVMAHRKLALWLSAVVIAGGLTLTIGCSRPAARARLHRRHGDRRRVRRAR